ncbi:MAG: hypothetical protein R3F31_15585 [Verrucomicrobiales bacterium]
MTTRRFLAVAFALCLLSLLHAGDWPWWRGPNRNGVAEAEPMPLLQCGGAGNAALVPAALRACPWIGMCGWRPCLHRHG